MHVRRIQTKSVKTDVGRLARVLYRPRVTSTCRHLPISSGRGVVFAHSCGLKPIDLCRAEISEVSTRSLINGSDLASAKYSGDSVTMRGKIPECGYYRTGGLGLSNSRIQSHEVSSASSTLPILFWISSRINVAASAEDRKKRCLGTLQSNNKLLVCSNTNGSEASIRIGSPSLRREKLW
jgi:hypothetical protein